MNAEQNGFIAGCIPHPIHEDSHEHLDSLEDRFRELLAARRPIKPLLAQIVAERAQVQRDEHFNWWIEQMLATKNAKLRAVQIGLACGASSVAERSCAEWARFFGVRKQAVWEVVQKIRRKYGLRKTRAMRSEIASENMLMANRQTDWDLVDWGDEDDDAIAARFGVSVRAVRAHRKHL